MNKYDNLYTFTQNLHQVSVCYEETTLVMADREHGDDKLSWRLEVKEGR